MSARLSGRLSSGLRRVDADLHGATGFDSAVAATLPLLLISGAEACSFACTATTDEIYCAAEESLWGVAFLCFTPVALALYAGGFTPGVRRSVLGFLCRLDGVASMA